MLRDSGGTTLRGVLGTGSIRWEELFAALREIGHDGTVTFESSSSEVVHRTLPDDLAIRRDPWTDDRALARDALAFTRTGLRG